MTGRRLWVVEYRFPKHRRIERRKLWFARLCGFSNRRDAQYEVRAARAGYDDGRRYHVVAYVPRSPR